MFEGFTGHELEMCAKVAQKLKDSKVKGIYNKILYCLRNEGITYRDAMKYREPIFRIIQRFQKDRREEKRLQKFQRATSANQPQEQQK